MYKNTNPIIAPIENDILPVPNADNVIRLGANTALMHTSIIAIVFICISFFLSKINAYIKSIIIYVNNAYLGNKLYVLEWDML